MKPSILFTTLALVFSSPTLLAKTELETLRALCKEQERQIQWLEQENAQLKDTTGHDSRAKATTVQSVSKTPAATGNSTYTVRAGDSFGKIARKVGTTPESLAKMNGLKISAIIQPGQTLKIPGASPAPKATQMASSASGAATHKVQPGETFFSIARKHGMTTEAVMAANPSIKPSALRPGEVVSLVNRAPATNLISNSSKPSAVSSAQAATRTPAAVPNNIPVSTPPPAPVVEEKINPRPITIDTEMTYGDFAANHGTDTERLNALNGLDLTKATVLAKGSELYVPAQP